MDVSQGGYPCLNQRLLGRGTTGEVGTKGVAERLRGELQGR
jgi:hypothetical protein